MLRSLVLILLCGVGGFGAAAGGTVVVPVELPAEGLIAHASEVEVAVIFDVPATEVVGVQLRLRGERDGASWWSCFGDPGYAYTLTRPWLSAGFVVDGTPAHRVERALEQMPTSMPMDELFEWSPLDGTGWEFLESGTVTLSVGPHRQFSDNPCGSGGIFAWSHTVFTEIDLIFETSGPVSTEGARIGWIKALYR